MIPAPGPNTLLLQPAQRRLLILLDPEMGHITMHLRGLLFQHSFAAAGWQVEFVNIREMPLDQIVVKAREFPAVYLLKVCFLRLVRELQQGAPDTRIIFDLTDALWQPFHRACGWQHLEKILAAADAIFSENEFICAYGRQFARPVYAIPACTQVHKFDALRQTHPARADGQVRMGWMGSNGTTSALRAISQPFQELFDLHPQLYLRILGCSDPALLPPLPEGRYSVLAKYDEDTMIRECLDFDIGLFPPPGDVEDYKVRGALKGMLYMTAGVPPVCLDAGDCGRIMVDGQTAMLIGAPEEWETKLGVLIRDPALRHQMGAAALAAIRQGHTIEAVFAALESALISVIQTPK